MPKTGGTPADSPESIQGAVIRTASYIFVPNRDGNLYVPYLIENDGKVVLNWNWLDNDWDANNPTLRFAHLFVSLLESCSCRVFFFFVHILCNIVISQK